jgi:hypothetical protein
VTKTVNRQTQRTDFMIPLNEPKHPILRPWAQLRINTTASLQHLEAHVAGEYAAGDRHLDRATSVPWGTTAHMKVSETTSKDEAGTPLKFTPVAPVSPFPRICTLSPGLPKGTTNVMKGPSPMSRLKTVP